MLKFKGMSIIIQVINKSYHNYAFQVIKIYIYRFNLKIIITILFIHLLKKIINLILKIFI